MRSEPAMRATLVQPAAVVGALPLVVALAGIGVIYRETLASLVSVWLQSDTFAHCFLVAPISLFLIWQRRDELAGVRRRVSPAGIAAVLALGLGWLVAASADVQLGQQAMVVVMIPACVLALFGAEFTKRIVFPLGYLLLAVPFGEWLIQPLMNFTADFAVAALRLTGIPVLREGVYFSIPSGDFEVAKGCSGIRYLIACLAIGVLYTYFAYRTWPRRLLFVALSLVVPIVGNGIRAYLIVMIAHLSDMRLAVGVDHLIYGWIFFGVIVALMLWIGSLFADAPHFAAPPGPKAEKLPGRGLRAAAAAALVIGAAAVGPSLAGAMPGGPASQVLAVQLPRADGAWQGPFAVAAPTWETPDGNAALAVVRAAYRAPTATVEIAVLTHGASPSDEEVVGSLPALIDTTRWQIMVTRHTRAGADVDVQETELRTRSEYAVLWHWYVVGDASVSADWQAKAIEAWRTLTRGRADTAMIVLSARSADPSAARQAVQSLFDRYAGSIARCLSGGAADCAPPGN